MNFDILEILIYGWGALLVFFLISYIMMAQNILGLVFKKTASRLINREECPRYIQELYAEKESQLLELGFKYSHCQVTEDVVQKKHGDRYYFIYFHEEKKVYASIVLSYQADSLNPVLVTFQTFFADGTTCDTLDGVRHDLIDTIPGSVLQDNYTGILKKQWALHLDYLEKNPHLEIKTFERTESGFREKMDFHDESYVKYLNHLEQKGYLYRTEGGAYMVKTLASIRIVHAIRKSMKKLAMLRQELKKNNQKVDLPIEVDVVNFQNMQGALNAESRNKAGKFLFLMVTLALFVVTAGLIFSFETAFLLMAVIFIHECGHLLAMYLFGYKNLRMLFIPLFGAAAIGTDEGVAPYKKVITYFAGPLPGIIFAVVLILNSSHLLSNKPLLNFILMLVIINYFNLIPVMPLDGGQILNTVLFSRTHWLQTIFLIFSVLIPFGLGIYLSSPVLLILTAAALFSLYSHLSQRKIQRQLKERLNDGGTYSREDILTETISILRQEPKYNDYSVHRKFTLTRKIVDGFNTAGAPLKTTLITLFLYIFLMLLPIFYIVVPLLSGKGIPFLQ